MRKVKIEKREQFYRLTYTERERERKKSHYQSKFPPCKFSSQRSD